MRSTPALCLAVLTLACSTDPVAPVAPRQLDLHPGFAVSTNSSGGLNVFRFGGEFAVGFPDVDDDLFAIAGLPDDPNNFVGCGGTDGFQITDYQLVGLLQQAVNALVRNGHSNLNVYQLSTFGGCGSFPIAAGVGRVVYTDNDFFVSGTKNRSWGFQMEGTVALASGGKAHLMAHSRGQIQLDGTFRDVLTDIKLTRQ